MVHDTGSHGEAPGPTKGRKGKGESMAQSVYQSFCRKDTEKDRVSRLGVDGLNNVGKLCALR